MPKILQISDLHILPQSSDRLLGIDTEFYFHRVLSHAHQRHGNFDLIIVSGDLAQDPCQDSYQRILQCLHDYRTPTVCLPGNHDDVGLMQEILQDEFVSCRKHTVVQGWQIIALNSQKPNSPAGVLTDDELAFLQLTLQRWPNLPAMIAVHHHCVASGSRWLDTMQIENSSALLEILEGFPQVKAITYGHVHQECAFRHHNIDIFSSPASCFQFTLNAEVFSIADSSPGYRVFDLSADGSLQSWCQRIPDKLQALDRDAHGY